MLASRSTRVRFRLWLVVGITAVTTTACKEATITDVPVDIARIDVSASTLTLRLGEAVTVTAVPKSESGQSLTARPVQWTTSNASIAQVTPSGQVNAVGIGTATLTASSAGVSAQVNVTVTFPNFTINVDNLLVYPVNITVNGTAAGMVDAATSRAITVAGAATVNVSWAMIRPTTTTGVPIGEELSGVFDPVVAGTNTVFDFEVDNEIGTTKYFGVFIVNTGPERLLIGVNMGLLAENRCNCLLPNTGVEFRFGYYRLFSNSNVRAYHETSNYTGGFVFWDGPQINSLVQSGSGAVHLATNIAPPGPASAVRGAGTIPPAPVRATARPATVHRNDRPPRPGDRIGLEAVTRNTLDRRANAARPLSIIR